MNSVSETWATPPPQWLPATSNFADYLLRDGCEDSRGDHSSLLAVWTELTCLLNHQPFQTFSYLLYEYLTIVMNIEKCLKARHLSYILKVTRNLKITSSIYFFFCIPPTV